ncbi:PREDICTED: kinesin-like protein KIN-7N isoform X2 [Nelumbo nucifera]|uniref:Kinesin-like protein KIN-7N isoform X2 n=1 Tax=Nelumbo nucifera TaxID=4432 RepID=A0A1U8BAM4_NELNU|nr:PREDICTED: kinesin-like protein KIN-7N isoform X2 [Nelumbo nucifera]
MEKICVAVRVRPPVSQEVSNGLYWKVEDNRISLHKPLGTPISGVSYAFDHVFDQNCTNAKVYELLTKDIIRAAVEGFNGTAFAYGQTSSGKTFTMNGRENDPGIIHLAVKDIFQNIQMAIDREFLIRVSYMEIYNEEINDLLAPENQKLQVHESLERGIFVAGLREEIVNNTEQVIKLIELGEVNRHFGQTNMNARSSRSHTIFRMVIESKGKDTTSSDYSNSDAVRVSFLNLVDLAGSERIAKTGAGGVRLKEGKHINKSLMVLGNVINKLSDGSKQRGHIPYRDSKLTRILQPALGGNAKTSIICTVAPEEIHIEETKGTLQFASRAKRITNCVQVNEILTDAALLKRQKLEIEELRKKLQGSRAEVLEQEILKLRNEMLKYELEHEKLAMELEEERKSHKERDRCIKEQQMKIDNLSNLVSCSEQDRNSVQNSNGHPFSQRQYQSLEIWEQSLKEDSNDNYSIFQGDAFRTPCFKAAPNTFVAKRSDYSMPLDTSPIPDDFGNVADEDLWLRLNKGQATDLDSLQMTPARENHSFPSIDASPGYSIDYYKEEIQKLKQQLEHAIKEKDELERNNAEQLFLNSQLLQEISELQHESLLIREIPPRLCESVANCKDIYKDVLSMMQSFVADEKSSTAKLLSSTSDIAVCLFSTLETHFSMDKDGCSVLSGENSPIQEQWKVLVEKLKSAATTLASLQAPTSEHQHLMVPVHTSKNEGFDFGGANASWMEKLGHELNAIKEKYQILDKDFNHNNKLLESFKEKCHSLERECSILKEEKTFLVQKLSKSSQKLELVTDQRDKLSKDLSLEVQKRKELEREITRFSLAFARRQKALMTFHGECKSKIEFLRTLSPGSKSKTLGY